MLIYFCTQPHRYTIEPFLNTWGVTLKPRFRVVAYREAEKVSFDQVSTVIFSDYDRLPSDYRTQVGLLADQLVKRRICVLNHPQRSLLRAPLLHALHAARINSYRAFLASELPPSKIGSLHFPVFARLANDHQGPATMLLQGQEALQRMLDEAKTRGIPPQQMLIVEFCDTKGADGLYRKYSCFCVDGTILPRHMIASTRWVLRIPDLVTPELIEEEKVFLETNPHEQLIRRVFEIAKMGYGRIDYSMVGDQVQIWEINSNPYVMYPPEKYQPLQLPNQQWFAPRITKLFEALIERGTTQ
jgi:hypothetical protein